MRVLFKSAIISFLIGLSCIPAPANAQRITAFQAVSMALQRKDMSSFYRILNKGYNLDGVDENGMGHVCYAIIHK
ncbi:MAG: hypothetical protein J6U64_03370, partial [Alphaproteobacteria bacterium]|nr:hypothetical protein [Alphaproteobacteria bacterium]